ncbi:MULTISPECIES: hypothetical protein [Prevotellaceae]|uniref:hypothetical protein n=1 Tax=Prevotellaceae TaxID=171552 RepID=UPI0003D2C70C|nr:hypothetical protein [Prevotella phocaeensis]ETD21796.1 hypothetical protein HMPREF1199_00131 [Hoylesella oralis CC98A]
MKDRYVYSNSDTHNNWARCKEKIQITDGKKINVDSLPVMKYYTEEHLYVRRIEYYSLLQK